MEFSDYEPTSTLLGVMPNIKYMFKRPYRVVEFLTVLYGLVYNTT